MLRKVLIALLLIISAASFLYEERPHLAPYNPKLSEDYVYLAVLSYCPKKCIEAWTCKGRR